MQKQTQTEATETLETVRGRLAARRGAAEVDTEEPVVESLREEPPVYLLGGAGKDIAVALGMGLIPALLIGGALMGDIYEVLSSDRSRWIAIGAVGLAVVLWVVFFTMLRAFRTARRTLTWPLCLYAGLAAFVFGSTAWARWHAKDGPWIYAVLTVVVCLLQALTFQQAYQKRG